MKRHRAVFLAVFTASSLSAITAALAYENGRLPRSVLSRIYHPSLELYLEKDAAASWNTMRLYFVQRGREIYPLGPICAYRTYEEQVQAKAEFGSNAATPGTSNHGWGLAVDLATTEMRSELDRWGAPFGWQKQWSDASWEWWHIKYRYGIWHQRPDPGLDTRSPNMEKGSGGPAQDVYVKEIQRELKRHHFPVTVDGSFESETVKAVKEFQAAYHLRVTGIVNKRTWAKLRGPVLPPPAPPSPAPTTNPLTTTPGLTGMLPSP
jgi:hypothetical protein